MPSIVSPDGSPASPTGQNSSELLDFIASKWSNELSKLKRLHLGCGKDLRAGWVNVDLFPATEAMDLEGVEYFQADCERPLPFMDNTFGEVFGSHFIEHIENTLGLMQELHRICAPGAICRFTLPHGGSNDAHEDPTHKRVYYPNSFQYFAQPTYWRADYGYRGDWQLFRVILKCWEEHCQSDPRMTLKMAHNLRNVVAEMEVQLRCVKPIREQRRELMDTPEIHVMPVKMG